MTASDFLALAVAVLLVVAITWAAITDMREWDRFKIEHHCKIVGMERGNTSTGVGTDGKVIFITTPGKTGWLCDDGVTYWR